MNLETLEKGNDLADTIRDVEVEIGYMTENFIAVDFTIADGRCFPITHIDPETWESIREIISRLLRNKLIELKAEFEQL